MKIFKFLFQFILLGIGFASVIPHLFPNYWLTEIFSHFKVQYIVLLLVFLLPTSFFLIKNKLIPITLILILLGWNCWFIIPLYLQNSDQPEASGETFSILSINLLASNTKYSEALKLITEKDPDVVVLLELSPEWEKQMQHLNNSYPFKKMFSRTDNFGMGILSKVPMVFSVTDFGKGLPPSILSEIEISGQPVTILATHPFPPVSQYKLESRNIQFKEIAKISRSRKGSFIVAGDLYSSSYSKHFQELLEQGELEDSRNGFGILTSWPTDYLIMRTTLDHFLVKGKMNIIERSTERNIGSDHLPIFMKVRF